MVRSEGNMSLKNPVTQPGYDPQTVRLVTHRLNHYATPDRRTKHSPSWKANGSSASQEIPRILWNPKVPYRIHKHPPPAPILSKIKPIHDLPMPLPEDHSQYYSPIYALVFQIVSFPQVHRTKTWCTYTVPYTCYMHHQSHSSWSYHLNSIWRAVQIIKLFIM